MKIEDQNFQTIEQLLFDNLFGMVVEPFRPAEQHAHGIFCIQDRWKSEHTALLKSVKLANIVFDSRNRAICFTIESKSHTWKINDDSMFKALSKQNALTSEQSLTLEQAIADIVHQTDYILDDFPPKLLLIKSDANPNGIMSERHYRLFGRALLASIDRDKEQQANLAIQAQEWPPTSDNLQNRKNTYQDLTVNTNLDELYKTTARQAYWQDIVETVSSLFAISDPSDYKLYRMFYDFIAWCVELVYTQAALDDNKQDLDAAGSGCWAWLFTTVKSGVDSQGKPPGQTQALPTTADTTFTA